MRGWQVAETQQTVCPIISLPSSWEEYLHQIGRKQRHEVRRKMKIFTELGGTFEFISQPTTSDFTDFTKLHRASSSEKASYWNECTTTFFQRLFDIGVHEGWLQLSFAKLGTRRVAACFLFVEHDQWSLYNTGFDLNQAQSQAGNALLAWIIQRATMLGVKRFDFLRGDESYKFRMGAVAQPLYTLQLHKV
jgi:CelD/BcsL family acetyltransferase involved in cellulose biosynthesis